MTVLLQLSEWEGRILLKLIKELFIIILFSLFGEVISLLLSKFMVVPGSVIGMLLLFFALHYKWIKMSAVEEAGTWLTSNMAILFVPAGVGLIANFDTLAKTWWQLVVIIALTTALMMAMIGRVVQRLKRRADKSKEDKTHVE